MADILGLVEEDVASGNTRLPDPLFCRHGTAPVVKSQPATCCDIVHIGDVVT